MFKPDFKRIEKLAIDNSPVLLTAIGVIGTIGTAIFTHKATLRATEILKEEEIRRISDPEIDFFIDGKETFKLTWKCYIPPLVSGSSLS